MDAQRIVVHLASIFQRNSFVYIYYFSCANFSCSNLSIKRLHSCVPSPNCAIPHSKPAPTLDADTYNFVFLKTIFQDQNSTFGIFLEFFNGVRARRTRKVILSLPCFCNVFARCIRKMEKMRKTPPFRQKDTEKGSFDVIFVLFCTRTIFHPFSKSVGNLTKLFPLTFLAF